MISSFESHPPRLRNPFVFSLDCKWYRVLNHILHAYELHLFFPQLASDIVFWITLSMLTYRNCAHLPGGMCILLKSHIQFCSWACVLFSDCTFFCYFKTWFHCQLGPSHNPLILGGTHWLTLCLSIPFSHRFLQSVSFSISNVTYCLIFSSC